MAVVVADLGTAIVLVGTAAVVFFVAGLEAPLHPYRAVSWACSGACAAIAAKPYRLVRVISYVDPQFKVVDKIDKQRLDPRRR